MRFPEATDGSFGRLHFGEASLTDARRVTRLVQVADQILTRPAGTLPQKLPDPYQLDALYRLLAALDVTHAAVPHTHCQLTHRRMRAQPVVVRPRRAGPTRPPSGPGRFG